MADTNPSAVVGAVADAYLGSRCLHVIADFRIADIVDDAPRPIAEIADAVGVNAEALTRVLRHLGALGIFSVASGGVAHNDASRLLRSDDPGGLLPLIRLLGLPLLWDAFRDLDVAVATGRPAVANRHPEGFFGYLAAHPEESKVYDAARWR